MCHKMVSEVCFTFTKMLVRYLLLLRYLFIKFMSSRNHFLVQILSGNPFRLTISFLVIQIWLCLMSCLPEQELHSIIGKQAEESTLFSKITMLILFFNYIQHLFVLCQNMYIWSETLRHRGIRVCGKTLHRSNHLCLL